MRLRGSESIVSSISTNGNFLMGVVVLCCGCIMEMWRQRRDTSLRYLRSVVSAASSSLLLVLLLPVD